METPSASLHRGHPRKMIAGVCVGLAARFGWEPVIVRAIFALATLFSFGLAFWAYVILWVVLPDSENGTSLAEDLLAKVREMFTAPPAPPSNLSPPTTPSVDL